MEKKGSKFINRPNLSGGGRTVTIYAWNAVASKHEGVNMVTYEWEKNDKLGSSGTTTTTMENFDKVFEKYESE